MILRRVTSLELMQYGMKKVIWLDSHSILAKWRPHFWQLYVVRSSSKVS